MLIFKTYNDTPDVWDTLLRKNNYYDVRHSYNYYKYLKIINQKSIITAYLVYRDKQNKDNLIGQFIVKKKKYLFFNIIYIYCGPSNIENYLIEFSPKTIINQLKVNKWLSYIRFKSFLPESEVIDKKNYLNNWKRIINFEENLFIDLKQSVTCLKKNLSRNWRHNFYRSKKNLLETKILKFSEFNKIFLLYEEMCKIKKIDMPFSKPDFEQFCNIFKNDILTIAAYSNGRIVSVRSAVIFHDKALDIFAATSLEGRSNFASYRLLWEIILLCKRKKIRTLDLNGIDKKKKPRCL